jgi:hypothetical protein
MEILQKRGAFEAGLGQGGGQGLVQGLRSLGRALKRAELRLVLYLSLGELYSLLRAVRGLVCQRFGGAGGEPSGFQQCFLE